MSDVFISYARSTQAAARTVAETLRRDGYEVWMDDQLPAHRAYADVIEERLRAAKSVVVIWSADAVKSEWVRSEAELAREGRKLVQLTVDRARLPMPFNQFQCADLSDWHGEPDAQGWRQVTSSIVELTGGVAEHSNRTGGRPAIVSGAEPAPKDDLHRLAARRADAEIRLRKHALSFVVVNTGLAMINLMSDSHHLWFQWPLAAWGIGLAVQGLSVFRIAHEESREEIIARKLRKMRPPDGSGP